MSFRLDIHVYPDGSLVEAERLQLVQECLASRAPRWASGLHVWRHGEAKLPVAVSEKGSLEKAVRQVLSKRGPLFAKLQQEHGPTRTRLAGSVELRGLDRSLVVVLRVDEDRLVRRGGERHWGNSVGVQVCRSTIEGAPGVDWAAETFVALCESLSPLYGHAETIEEYDSKNMSRADGGLAAVGLDVSRSLPGLYWLNFFGRQYVDLMGAERLLETDVGTARSLEGGVLVQIWEDAREWATAGFREAELAVRNRIGSGYFFTKAAGYGSSTMPKLEDR